MNAHREQRRRDLLEIYRAGLSAVAGDWAVLRALEGYAPGRPVHVVAVGKAASAMAAGSVAALGPRMGSGLLITKEGHLDPALQREPRFQCLESAHPIPDGRSLEAGRVLVDHIRGLPERDPVLFLVSGGASSLVEVLAEGIEPDDWFRLNEYLLSHPLDIGRINAVRKAVSAIKGGRLARLVAPRRSRVLMISDVAGDDPAVIGSGLMVPSPRAPEPAGELPAWVSEMCRRGDPMPPADDPCFRLVEPEIVAANGAARAAAARHARELGYTVLAADGKLAGDVLDTGQRVARELVGDGAGIRIWGGECTVDLPPAPGRGGRCQSLALTAALLFEGLRDVYLLAAGTDGTDGPTADAGALVDCETVDRGRRLGLDPELSLQQADAGRFLEASGDLIHTGPTGTNVTDLVIGLNDGYRHRVL